MSFELKLQNMVLDLKKVESAESIEDLLDYKFENNILLKLKKLLTLSKIYVNIELS